MAGASARWLVLLLVAVSAAAAASGKQERWRMSGAVGGQVVEKERRRVVAKAEAGTVTAVDVADAAGTAYRLHFITMDPGALFLPVQLHADMVFYVHSGRGKVTYIEEDSGEQSSLEVERGDVYNLEQGSILYIQSYPNATRQRLRIYAIFTSEGINADDPSKPKVEAYSSVSNLLKGFETEVLRRGFGVQREVAEAIKSAKTRPSIIPYNPQEKGDDEKPNWTEDIVDALLGVRDPEEFLNKKKDKHKHKEKGKKSKSKAFNFYSGKPDVHNCYGWSKAMTNKDLDALHGSNIGMFIVNLTTGSMMGPHWNPKATEIAIVTDGSGIVQTVCPSSRSTPSDKSRRGHHHGDERRGPGGRGDEGDKGRSGATRRCRNSVFRVKEGDVFVVPRFHPMAQMSFNNDSFVFVGFSTHMGQNHPQFLAGKGSVLQAIGKEVLSLSLGQKNSSAVEKLLSSQKDSTILSCISCAEELEEKATEEERRQREEERREQEEREKREREEEERRKEKEEEEREREEEERRKEKEEKEKREREEEERRKEKEEKREREEEERRKEQEERERKEREEKQREEEEERQRRKEEERARREEEERAREEEERRREEEEGGGGRGDEPEREEEDEGTDEPLYRLSKKLKASYRAGTFRSG
ncbi:unnamed protein product [Urochloa humidicola]